MNRNYYIATFFFLATSAVGVSVSAQDFQPIIGIPGITSIDQLTIGGYINAIFGLVLAAAAILAVVKIMLAGFQYMFNEVVPRKEQAKKDLWGALIGLLIVFGSLTILNEINPGITNFDILNERVTVEVSCEDAGTCEENERAKKLELLEDGKIVSLELETVPYAQDVCEAHANYSELKKIPGPGDKYKCK